MAPHAEDVVVAPLQRCSPSSPVRKTLTLSSIGSQILSSNFKYLKTVDGFIKLIHVVSVMTLPSRLLHLSFTFPRWLAD